MQLLVERIGIEVRAGRGRSGASRKRQQAINWMCTLPEGSGAAIVANQHRRNPLRLGRAATTLAETVTKSRYLLIESNNYL